MFGALAKRGHEGDAYERDGELHASCRIGDTRLGLEFHIIGKHRTEVRGGYRRPVEDLPASTPLRLALARMSATEVLRALVGRVKAGALAGRIAIDPVGLERWERWALAQADRIDPVLSGQILSHLVVPELDDSPGQGGALERS